MQTFQIVINNSFSVTKTLLELLNLFSIVEESYIVQLLDELPKLICEELTSKDHVTLRAHLEHLHRYFCDCRGTLSPTEHLELGRQLNAEDLANSFQQLIQLVLSDPRLNCGALYDFFDKHPSLAIFPAVEQFF
jgi:hypothetical protein